MPGSPMSSHSQRNPIESSVHSSLSNSQRRHVEHRVHSMSSTSSSLPRTPVESGIQPMFNEPMAQPTRRSVTPPNALNPPPNNRSISLPSDSSTQVIQLLHQLQAITGSHRDDPVSVLSASLERIQMLQAQAVLMERRLHDSSLSCAEAEQRALASESRARQSEEVVKAVWSFSTNLQAIQQTSFPSSTESSSRVNTPTYTSERSLEHTTTWPTDSLHNLDSMPASASAMDQSMNLSSFLSQSSTQAAVNVPITAIVDSTGTVVQCSSSFAELFGFNYFLSHSPPGVYNLSSLAPRDVQDVVQLLQQARHLTQSTEPSLSCILTVDGWKRLATVLMSLRRVNSNDYVSIPMPNEQLFWASFDVLSVVDAPEHQSLPAGRSHPSRSFP